MCDDNKEYNVFPPKTIGGPTGNYSITADVVSSEYIEYRVVQIAMGDTSPGNIFVTGDALQASALNTIPYGGTVTLNDNSFARGLPFRLGATTTLNQPSPWIRVTNPQKIVSVRIDCPALTSAFIAIQFRDKILTKIPQPFKTVLPEDEKEYHNEREKRIKEAFGREGELELYGKSNGNNRRIRGISTEPGDREERTFKRDNYSS